MARSIPAALLLLLLTAPVRAQGPLIGVNQAWVDGKYGHDLTRSFARASWARVFDRARAAGLRSVRVWLFEGMEGIAVDARGLPSGPEPGLLEHVETLVDLAEARGLSIYWTLHDGNLYGRTDEQRRLLLGRDGYGAAFRARVLAPVLACLARRPARVFAIDLINEVQGSIKGRSGVAKVWPDGWTGARRYLRTTASFVHRVAPGLRVAASSGHHEAVRDVLAGRFDGLGLDLIDVHVYSGGTIPDGERLRRHAAARGLPLVLGECGPNPKGWTGRLAKLLSKKLAARYQARVLERFVRAARALGFEAVFPWRMEDTEPLFGLIGPDGRPRPALERLRELSPPPAPCRGLADRISALRP